ncbi:Hsp70 family protein [Geodermatophilus marinus]|uniref:Hsp70 family protein n=1 Tax=Geodermatophilus sp. LHW52908 TaxID=2303986 RepID=UPI000E3D4CA0|nr:Hsp70 family protein [Geodermatophilus sp. LHW52908]RFU22479.1 cell surface protein [Geodermatophilus sp. LHW52908]
MSYCLGVDLGTTFVAAAIAHDTSVEMVVLGDRATVMPAAVHVRDDGVLVTGDAAARRAVSSPDRVATEFKRRLGDPTPVLLGGTSYPVTDLLGALLRDVLARVGEERGGPPEEVVLTHPANWGPFRRELFEEVPRYAGLSSALTVTEPEAAAAFYATVRRLGEGEVIAVYDLGGGTFDATVLQRTSHGIEILGAPEGIERLGGADFDEAVLAHVNHAAGGALSELDLGDPRTVMALARLRQDCVLAKEALSVDTETVIPVFLPGRHLDVRLTRAQFEDMIRAPVESTIGTLSRALRTAEVPPDRLSAVLLVGGSSRIPLIGQTIAAELQRPVVVDAHPKHAVALGAAILAQTHAGVGGPGARDEEVPTAVAGAAGTAPPAPLPPPRAAAPARVEAAVGAPAEAPPPAGAPGAPGRPPSPAGPPEAGGNGHGRGTGAPPWPGAAAGAWAGAPPAPPPALPRRGRPRRRGLLIGAAVLVVVVVLGAVLGGLLLGDDPDPGTAGGGGPSAEAQQEPGPAPAPAEPEAAVPIPTIGAPIDVGPTSGFVAVSPNGRQLYVANRAAGVVTVVDTAVDAVTATIPIAAGPPQFLTFSPDGSRLYVSVFDDARTIAAVTVLDTSDNSEVTTVPVRTRPYLGAVTPDGSRLFVPNHDSGSISVIDSTTDAVVDEVQVPANPHWIEFTPDGSRAYVANHESNVVTALDPETLAVVAEVPVEVSPHSVAVHPTRPLVANVNYDSASVTMIDTTTHTVVATVPVGANPQDITWSADGRFAYTANVTDDSVSVINAETFEVTARLPVGDGPTSVAVLPDGSRAFVSILHEGRLVPLDLAG